MTTNARWHGPWKSCERSSLENLMLLWQLGALDEATAGFSEIELGRIVHDWWTFGHDHQTRVPATESDWTIWLLLGAAPARRAPEPNG
jgi:hypothetical protein